MERTMVDEILKLKSVDLKVASWLQRKQPGSLLPYLLFIASNEYQRRGERLNPEKIYKELTDVRRQTLLDLTL